MTTQTPIDYVHQPDPLGHFGMFGGKFVPETLMTALKELEEAYAAAKADPDFMARLADLNRHYSGRPTPLYHAQRLTDAMGGAPDIISMRSSGRASARRSARSGPLNPTIRTSQTSRCTGPVWSWAMAWDCSPDAASSTV